MPLGVNLYAATLKSPLWWDHGRCHPPQPKVASSRTRSVFRDASPNCVRQKAPTPTISNPKVTPMDNNTTGGNAPEEAKPQEVSHVLFDMV
jgi:hypothetical protein